MGIKVYEEEVIKVIITRVALRDDYIPDEVRQSFAKEVALYAGQRTSLAAFRLGIERAAISSGLKKWKVINAASFAEALSVTSNLRE